MELVHGNFLAFLKLFFIPQDFLFSLFGAIFWFSIIFLIKTHHSQKERLKYLDAIVHAFLLSSIVWYLASFLWGQTYGIPLSSPLSVTYNHIDSIIKDRSPLFPLSLLYMLTSVGIIFGLRKFSLTKRVPDGFMGYIGIGIFSLILFFGEYLSGSRKDIFYDYFSLGLNQIWALIGIIFVVIWLLRIIQKRV
jgi:prolipoprotein diacylglyceryltransferase